MTIREKICEAGVSTLKQLLCLGTSEPCPPVEPPIIVRPIIINSDIIEIEELPFMSLEDVSNDVRVEETTDILILEYDPTKIL